MMVGRKSFLTVLAKIPRKVKLQYSDESGPLEANPKFKGYKEAILSMEEVQHFIKYS